jgi:TonB family protein
LSAVPPGSQTETAEQQIERARIALSRRDLGEAKKTLKRALKLKDDSSEAWLLLARVHRLEGKKDDAFKYVKKAIASDAGYVQAQTFYARLLFEAGKAEQARTQLKTALAMTPKDPNAYVLSGEVYLQEKKYKEAVDAFEHGIKIAPANDTGTTDTQAWVDGIKRYLAFKTQHTDDTVSTLPIMKNRPRPNYTEEARGARTQGLVRLILLINDTGDVTDLLVISGLPHGLTAEAIRAARRIRFSPALKGGIPVEHWQEIEVEFNLR